MNDRTMGDDRIDADLVDRYLAGECTPEERQHVEHWRATAPERRDLAMAVDHLWAPRQAHPAPADVEAAWRRVMAASAARADRARGEGLRRAIVQLPHHTRPASRAVRYAVAAAMLLLAAGLAHVLRTSQPAALRAPSLAREFHTRPGQHAEITLDDGTRVLLAAASRLRIPSSYGESSRDVELEGEGFFTVTHDARRPFRVHTAYAVSEDIGTTFGVRAYAADSGVRVVVASGAVALRRDAAQPAAPAGHVGVRHRDGDADSTALLLGAGDMGILGRSGPGVVRRAVDLDRWLAWTRNRVVLVDVPLAEAIPELERTYDLEIRLADPSLAQRHLTATFSDQSLREILSTIALLLDARYERTGRTVTFTH